MAALTLKSLISSRSDCRSALTALINVVGAEISIVDPAGKPLLGEISPDNSVDHTHIPVQFEDATLGFVVGPPEPASAIALLLLTILPSQSPSSVHRASVVAPVPAEMVPTAIQATSTAAPAVPKAPTPALQSEHVWRLRVFGITVFRYDAKAEGPHR